MVRKAAAKTGSTEKASDHGDNEKGVLEDPTPGEQSIDKTTTKGNSVVRAASLELDDIR